MALHLLYWEAEYLGILHQIKGLDKQIGNRHTDPTKIGLSRDPLLVIDHEPDEEGGQAHVY